MNNKGFSQFTVNKGVVWRSDDYGLPYCTNLSVVNFIDDICRKKFETIRICGMDCNSSLICNLFFLKNANNLKVDKIQVCSPVFCGSSEDRKSPDLVLYRMRKIYLATSIGGWSDINSFHSCCGFILSSLLKKDNILWFSSKNVTPKKVLVELYSYVWRVINFIGNVDVDSFVRLLALIKDPRWYLNPDYPDNYCRLESYLSINPFVHNRLIRNKKDGQVNRYYLVRNCWQAGRVKNNTMNIEKGFGPRDFLWREWARKGGGVKGELSAAKRFISFLSPFLISVLSGMSDIQSVFVPEIFFKNKDEVNCFNNYMKSM